jgi:hypothetical protein
MCGLGRHHGPAFRAEVRSARCACLTAMSCWRAAVVRSRRARRACCACSSSSFSRPAASVAFLCAAIACRYVSVKAVCARAVRS